MHCTVKTFEIESFFSGLLWLLKSHPKARKSLLHCACIVSLLCATYKGGEQKLDALASAVSLDLYYSKSECEKALLRVV